MSDGAGYSDNFVDQLQLIWGEGFIAPGGADEVRNILKGVDVKGKTVLDIGCGIGGAALMLAGEFEAEQVIGIDIGANLIDRAKASAANAGLSDRIEFKLIEPGPLPFDDASFDIVFSKDVLTHIEDKAGIYSEIFRVLKPGGRFAASDWLGGSSAAEQAGLDRYRDLTHLQFALSTAAEIEAVMQSAGLTEVRTEDYHEAYAAAVYDEVEQLKGPLRSHLLKVTDEATYNHTVAVRQANADGAAAGGLRPTYLYGQKSAH